MSNKPFRIGGLKYALVYTAHRLGYSCDFVPGGSGFIQPAQKKIVVGVDSSAEEQVVLLAHEIGHIIDNTDNPINCDELMHMGLATESYLSSKQCYERELAAWDQAKKLLLKMWGYGVVKDKFEYIKSRSLLEYHSLLHNAQSKRS